MAALRSATRPVVRDVTAVMHDYHCRLPEDVRLWPSIGNGHISMVARSENMSMNGLYNGFTTTSHRAVIPSPLLANVTQINSQETTNRTYVLNTKSGRIQFFMFHPQLFLLIYH